MRENLESLDTVYLYGAWRDIEDKDYFGTMFGQFLKNFGSFSGPFQDNFGTTLEAFLDHFGINLGRFWDHFWIIVRTF